MIKATSKQQRTQAITRFLLAASITARPKDITMVCSSQVSHMLEIESVSRLRLIAKKKVCCPGISFNAFRNIPLLDPIQVDFLISKILRKEGKIA
jgi:hypothetical protein